jgi:GTP-binding protein
MGDLIRLEVDRRPGMEAAAMPPFYELGAFELRPVSSAHGYGIKDFLDELCESFPPALPAGDGEDGEVRVAVIGRPNVGKSSLVNRLAGEERMVVSDMPGTTRDSVDTLLTLGGRNYRLIDTAGIRRKGKVRKRIEKFSVVRALKAIEESDVALVLIDAGLGIAEQDAKIIGYALERGRGCLVIMNKWDLVAGDRKAMARVRDEVERQIRFVGYAPVLEVSALTGSGCGRILPLVDRMAEQARMRFGTGEINRIIRRAVEDHSPPLYRGRRLKFLYATQVGTRPPAFLLFVNYPDAVHFSYRRYLANRLREGLGLDLVPFEIRIRERNREKRGGKGKRRRR